MGRSLPDRLVYDCLSSAIVRVIISTVVILVSFGGLLMYPSFSKELDVGVAPPPDSPAGIARDEMAKWFDPDPIQITAHVRTRDGSPLTNDDVAACAALAARRDGPLHRIGAQVFGPAPAPIARVRGRHRVRLLVKAGKTAPLQQALADWVAQVKLPADVRLVIDIDPQSFL
jgi:hypothetical protein